MNDDQDEGWKAGAAPGFKKPERDDSGLWDPVVRAPEPDVVERVELPVARVVKMDVRKDDDAATPLAKLVPAMLGLLEDGSINAAVAIEEDWRERGAVEDLGGASELVRTQWPLVRELVGVASELPVPIVQALAAGISAGEVASARPALEAFRATDASAANAANGLLAVRAKRLYDATGGALYTAPPPRPDYYASYVPPPTVSRSSGFTGWRIVSICAAVIVGILRVASQSHSTYEYHPIEIPSFDPKLYDLPPMPSYDPNLYNAPSPTTPPSPLPMQADADRSVLLDEIVIETQNLTTYGLVPDGQETKVDTFLGDALDDACPHMRVSFAKLEKLKPIDDAEKAAAAKEQVTAIRQRLDVVCPKRHSVSGKSK